MIRNREGESAYDVHWAWEDTQDGRSNPGLTCVFRVKNEARNLPWVLPPMLRAVQQVVLVDNGSDDGTAEVAAAVAAQCGATERYLGTSYPFAVARAGEEHRATPADSLHSLTYFYNWSFSHVRTAYSMKWDGDMVLTPEGERMLGDLSWQLEGTSTVVVVPRHPLTIVDEQTAWIDLSRKFNEPWVYPMGPEFTFAKAFDWEVREWPETAERLELPEGLAIELKWLDADEFSHWSDPSTFDRGRSPRKVREWEVDQAIRSGTASSVDGLVRIDAPAGVHVIEHVLHTWLPAQQRPLVRPRRAAVEPAASAASAAAAASQGGAPKGGNDILFQELDAANKPALVLLHEDLAHVRSRIPAGVDVLDLPISEVPPTDERYRSIFLCVPDRDALQRAVAVLPATRATKTIGVWVEWLDGAFTLQPREEWGPMLSQRSRRDGDEFILWARMRRWNPGRQMLAEMARQAVSDGLTPNAGVRVAVHGSALAPPGETEALRLAALADGSADDIDVPPDVIVSSSPSDSPLPEHHVTGRAPVVVSDQSGPLAIGALDERLLNPRGFLTHAPEPDAVLLLGGSQLVLRLADREITVPVERGATEQMVHALRTTRAARLAWPGESSLGFARAVAGLAMAGVPMVSSSTPSWARELLGDSVADLLSPTELDDELRREEHSVRLRRAALGEFSKAAWRRRVTAGTTLRPPASDTVSIVLATKREANLEHAMRQVARQRGADVELVLCPHGWDVDPARVRDLVEDLPVTVLPQPGDVLFGDVLAAGVDAAGGNIVLKLDDDDWYGPDVVSDLLLARSYTGAELVGMPAEMLYLAPLDETVRRTDPSETAGKFVAGGTMMIERDVLRSLGNFRSVRRYVDASLLADLLGAGGTVYRTQGLGYLFRRTDSGHTWEADMDYFLDPERLAGRWPGWRPSALMELTAPD